MAIEIEIIKAKEPLVEKLTVPLTKSMFDKYKSLSNELSCRGLTSLHELTRRGLDQMLREVEETLKGA